MQPDDPNAPTALTPPNPATPPQRIEPQYRFEWQPRSLLGGLVVMLVVLLGLTAAFMVSLLLLAGITLAMVVFTGASYWQRLKTARRRDR